MKTGCRLLVASAILVVAALIVRAEGISQAADVQLQLGDLLFAEGRFQDALEAYRKAAAEAAPDLLSRARSGVVMSALRVAGFEEARDVAEKLMAASPRNPETVALYGDTLWSMGMFE